MNFKELISSTLPNDDYMMGKSDTRNNDRTLNTQEVFEVEKTATKSR